ncbi:histidine phosphatase family protein [Myxococcota bacterium]|nr:histidine phosphatase family protein [Myxococcota bacterium]
MITTFPRRTLLAAALTFATGCATPSTATTETPLSGETTIILVRHAEKRLEPKEDDPPLTDAGRARAEELVKAVATFDVKVLYATEYKRTQETIAPLAKALGVEPIIRSSKDPAATAADIVASHAGRTILVAGHSNTVPDLIAALGGPKDVKIEDGDYDNLFVLVRSAAEARLLHLTYGAPTAP